LVHTVCATKTNPTMPPKKNTQASPPPDDDVVRAALATKKGMVAFTDEIPPPSNDMNTTIMLEGLDDTTNQKLIPSLELEVHTSSSDTPRDPPPNPKSLPY
jgi:hypothetical protein